MAHRRPWRRGQIAALTAALLLAVGLATFLAYRFTVESQLRRTKAKYPDLPRTMVEVLERHTAAIGKRDTLSFAKSGNEGEDVVTVIEECLGMEAFARQDRYGDLVYQRTFMGCSRLSAEQRVRLDTLRSEHRGVLDRLLRISSGPRARLALDDLDNPHGLYWDCDRRAELVSVLLGTEAESCAIAGDYPRMVSVFRALATMESVLFQTPAVNVRCGACRVHRAKLVALANILEHAPLPNAVLDEMVPCFQFSLYEEVRNEALLLHRDLGQFLVGDPRTYFRIFRPRHRQPASYLSDYVLAGGSAISGFAAKDQEQFLGLMETLIAGTQTSTLGRFERVRNSEANFNTFVCSHQLPIDIHVSHELMRDPFFAVRETYSAQRESQTVQTALAIERFRNDTGELPVSLDVLRPKYLAEIPVDPFTGRPLCYSRKERVYMVRSADNGACEVDDAQLGDPMFLPAAMERFKSGVARSS